MFWMPNLRLLLDRASEFNFLLPIYPTARQLHISAAIRLGRSFVRPRASSEANLPNSAAARKQYGALNWDEFSDQNSEGISKGAPYGVLLLTDRDCRAAKPWRSAFSLGASDDCCFEPSVVVDVFKRADDCLGA
jgi:hypothetical protein